MGGSVTDFGWGIYVAGGSDTVLSRLTVTGHLLAGVHIRDATGGAVVHSRILRNGLNGPDEDFAGLNLFTSNGVLIEGNDISRSGDIGLFAGVGRASRNIIKGNRFADNPAAAILLDGDDNLVDQNLFLHNGGGIGFGGDRNRVTSNVVLDIPPCTGDEGCGNALQVEGGLDNEISGNLVRRAPGGIAVQAYGPSLGRTLVSRNVIDGAYRDGIGVDVVDTGNPVTDTVLTRNLVTRSGDDGIDVRSRSTTLRRNGAFHNADLGIEAVAGVTDGGRNYAAGNGDPRQCTHMRCRHAD
jgi:nitrous oxidase accessory protein NosD